jgi:sulfite reductase alpha subunit-like flavoprotein
LADTYPLPAGQLPIPDDELLPAKVALGISDKIMEGNKHEVLGDITVESMDGVKKKPSQPERSPDRTGMESYSNMENPVLNNECLKEPLTDGESEMVDTDIPPNDRLPIPSSINARVLRNQRITAPDHFQDVRHISLIVERRLESKPGDIITIYPKNFPSDVQSLIDLQNWNDMADKELHFESKGKSWADPQYIPETSTIHCKENPTLRYLLLNNLDITAIPRRSFFDIISHFTDDILHKERLRDFSNPIYTDEFFDYATRPRRSILEILHDFPTVRIPFRWAITIFPPIRGRQFSIASGGDTRDGIPQAIKTHLQGMNDGNSASEDDNLERVDLVIALVKYRTVLKKIRQGLCSRYMTSLRPPTRIRITFQRGGFPDADTLVSKPILMIAPGTGLAPMRSLIQERALLRSIEPGLVHPSCILLFGGRSKNADFLFSHEWTNPDLALKVLTAFSRDQKEKIYVQDVVVEESQLVYQMLKQQGGTVIVCGSSGKMPTSVRKAIVEVFCDRGRVATEEAEEWLKAMEREGRYVQETW